MSEATSILNTLSILYPNMTGADAQHIAEVLLDYAVYCDEADQDQAEPQPTRHNTINICFAPAEG